MSNQFFKPSTYYVGDVKQVTTREMYETMTAREASGEVVSINDHQAAISILKFGNGVYFDQDGNSYVVHSPYFGIVDIALCDPELLTTAVGRKHGRCFICNIPFAPEWSETSVKFGDVEIDFKLAGFENRELEAGLAKAPMPKIRVVSYREGQITMDAPPGFIVPKQGESLCIYGPSKRFNGRISSVHHFIDWSGETPKQEITIHLP